MMDVTFESLILSEKGIKYTREKLISFKSIRICIFFGLLRIEYIDAAFTNKIRSLKTLNFLKRIHI